ncbi:unnamed protein product, partial [Bubo scandiacus]
EILRVREPQEQPGLWMPFAHGHPSFSQSKAPGDPVKTMDIKSIMEKPVCESVIPICRPKAGKVDGKAVVQMLCVVLLLPRERGGSCVSWAWSGQAGQRDGQPAIPPRLCSAGELGAGVWVGSPGCG